MEKSKFYSEIYSNSMRRFPINVWACSSEPGNTGRDRANVEPPITFHCRLLHFQGETLWQGADDNVVISLLRRNRSVYIEERKDHCWHFVFREIQVYFNHTKRLLPNDPRGNLWLDLESQEGRRVHQDWVTDVREINPFLLSYHVQVNYAETEDLEAPAHQCKTMQDLEVAMRPNTWIEPAVIFKLMNINMRPPLLKLCSPLSSVCCEEFLSG